MKAKTAKLWYLTQRFNPQLGTYWIKEGQLGKREAKAIEACNERRDDEAMSHQH